MGTPRLETQELRHFTVSDQDLESWLEVEVPRSNARHLDSAGL